MTRPPRVLTHVVALALGVVVLTGCSLESVPLPSMVHGPTYELQAQFHDALNLPQGAPVKLDGNVVGTVQQIRAESYVAHVTLRVKKSTTIPRGTRAEVRTTAPMGEAFVELTPPTSATPAMTAGDTFPLADTSTAPDVDDLLVALSASVTGGPFADISTIIKQLGVALDGRSGDVHSLLSRLDTVVGGLNAHSSDLDRVIDGMDRLSGELAGDAPTMSRALDDLAPAISTLRGQRLALMRLLGQITKLSGVSQKVITATRDSLVNQVNEVGPVLQTLIDHMDQMRPLMQGVLDFGAALDSASPGDYARFELTALLEPGSLSNLPGLPSVPGLPSKPGKPLPGLPTLPLPTSPSSAPNPIGGLGGLLGGGH